MPIHLDDLLRTPQAKPKQTHLDDILDYVAAGLQGIGGLLPNFDSDPGGVQYTANVVRTAAEHMAKHPGTVGETQGLVSAVPFVGAPVAALAEPSIEYAEGTAPSHEANVGAVGGGVALATLLAAPRLLKKAGELAERRGASESTLQTPEKPVAPLSEPSAANEPGLHIDDLLSQAGEAQAEAANRPREGTWQEQAAETLRQRSNEMADPIGAERERATRGVYRKHIDELDESDVPLGERYRIDELFDKNADPRDLAAGQEIYDGFERTRELLRQEHGDTIRLVRYDAPEELHLPDKTTLHWSEPSDRDFQAGAHSESGTRPLRDEQVPIDDIVAAPYLGKGKRQEFIVLNRASEALADPAVRGEAVPAGQAQPPGVETARFPEEPTAERAPISGMDIHIDDLLDDGDIVGEGPAPGKSFVVPKYPWAQNIKIPAREAPPSTPPSEPVQPSAPDTGWLDDLPEAESTPQQETPTPAELGEDLPEELTSEPKGTSAENVREMIGADADRELANSSTTRTTFFRKGSAMLRKPSQIFNALIVPGDDVLLKSGPAGQEAVRTTRPIELVRAQAVGKADALFHDMTEGMTSAQRGALGLILDGKMDINSPEVTPEMRAAANTARQFFNEYLGRAQDAGTGVAAKKDFFPHFRTTPIHDIEKPLPEFQKFGMESPSFHYHQVDDRAGYSLDLGYVMRRYAYNAETELQAIRAFGAADPETISNKIADWGEQIAKQGGDGVLAKKILLAKFNMESPELPAMRTASRDVAATVGAMNTVTTPIRHIGKYVNSLSQIGFRGAAKGLAKIAEAIADPAARQQIRESGVSLRNSMDLVIPNTKENAFYRITRALPWIKATKALDAGGRVMTYFGSDPWIDETVRVARGDQTYLGSMTRGMRQRAMDDAFNRAHNIFGISEQSIESGELTPREREYARLAASDVTEFNPERGQLPYAATVGAAGRLFYNLRKFATSQANFVYNNVVKPASYGNVKPLARFLAGSAVAGAVAEPLLHMVNRQPDAVLNYFGVPLRPEGDQTWGDWEKKAMAVGALHNLGLIYLMIEGRDILQAVPMASAGLLGRGVHGAVSDFVNAGRVSIGHPNPEDKVQEDLPQWWDEAQKNLSEMDGKNVKDVARSTQLTWLMRKWYREARGLQDNP